LTLLTSGVLAAVLAAGAETWMHLLYGPNFAAAAPYLRGLSLVYLPMAMVLVVDNYQLAHQRARFIGLYAIGVLAQVLVFVVPGGSPDSLILVLAVASGACLLRAFWVLMEELRGRGPGSSEDTSRGVAGV
jgi:hypothetical protein